MLNMNVKFLLRIIIVNIAIVQTIQCPINTMVNAARLCGTNYNQACDAYSNEPFPVDFWAVDHINDNDTDTMAGCSGIRKAGWMEIDLGVSREIKNVFTYIPTQFSTLGLNKAELRIGDKRNCNNPVCGESKADWGDGTENFESSCNSKGRYFCLHSNGIADIYALRIGELVLMTCPPTDCPVGKHPRSDGDGCESCASSYSASLLTSAFYGSRKMPDCIEFVQ